MSNSYDPNNFYSQNTSAWQSTTNQSNISYQQSGQFNGQPPSPKKKENAWGWYKRQKNITKIGVACGLALLFFLWASVVSALATGFVQGSTGQSATPTIVAQAPKMSPTTVHVIPTTKPTATPTATPMPTPTPTPTPIPTQPPVPTQPPAPQPTQPPQQSTGVNGNPWGYDFNPGNYIYNPPTNFCGYFNCITSFWQSTNGYVDECNDGTYSHSGGVSGACSKHGGEMRPLYSH